MGFNTYCRYKTTDPDDICPAIVIEGVDDRVPVSDLLIFAINSQLSSDGSNNTDDNLTYLNTSLKHLNILHGSTYC